MSDSLCWIIYVRVSSDLQMQNWSWLQSQETACREFAKVKGIEVVNVFSDGGVSGKHMSREALDVMIAYLKAENKNYTKISFVIIDDMDRLSRDTVGRWYIKNNVESSWAKLLSLKQNLDSTPEGVLQQNILMSMKQFERENNARRVKDRQRSRMLDGYRPLYPPPWYVHVKWEVGKKILALVEEEISIIKESLELFACWMFVTKEDFRDYVFNQWLKSRRSKKGIGRTFADRLLEERRLWFYAGYIDYKPWDINMVQAKHPAIIDKEIVQKILERLNPKALYKKYTYSEIDHKMPLRSVVVCESCWHVLTGWPSLSHTWKTYFYYSCRQRGCETYGKSFGADKIHTEFEATLETFKIKQSVITLLEVVCKDFHGIIAKDMEKKNTYSAKELKEIDKSIEQIQDRILWTDDTKIISLYEKKLRELLDKKQNLESMSDWASVKQIMDLWKLIEDTKPLLENPSKIRQEVEIEDKRLLIKVLFGNKMSYWKISGLWTSEIPGIYRDLSLFGWANVHYLEVQLKFLNLS